MTTLVAFMTAAFLTLSGLGIGASRNARRRIESQHNQQAQPAQITYASESAGTGNEPDVHESMPVYAPVVDEPTPEAMPEVDVDRQNDELVQEEKEEQPAEPARDEVPQLNRDMVNACTDACSQVAVVNGIDSAEALCGAYGVKKPFSFSYTYRKCVKPEAVEEVTAEANKIIDDAVAEFEKKSSDQEQQSNSEVHDVYDMLYSRAKEHGLDLTAFWREATTGYNYGSVDFKLRVFACNGLGAAREYVTYTVQQGSDDWRGRSDCMWLTQVGSDCSIVGGPRCSSLPFCEANKDFPGCEQFLDIYGNCEKILADAANKNEL